MINLNKKSMTKKVMEYQETGQGFDELQKELLLKAYLYPKYRLKWNWDLCSDFIEFLYPAIINSIHSYKDQGRTFYHYFYCTLNWQLLAFLRQKKERDTRWHNAVQKDFWDIPWLEKNADWKERRIDLKKVLKFSSNNRISCESEKRQFLFFALKKARTMTVRNIRYLAALTGYEKGWITTLVEQLKFSMQDKEKRLQIHIRRRKTAFAKMLIIGKSLESECDPEKRIQMQNKIARLRVVYNTACHRISRIQLAPSQKVIAEVTGYPKGTVDSAICAFKKKIVKVYLN